MRATITLVTQRGASAVRISADPTTPLEEILTRLAEYAGEPATGAVAIDGWTVGDLGRPWRESRLLEGSVVDLHAALIRHPPAPGTRISVAGVGTALAASVALLGSGEGCDIRIPHPTVSARHAVLYSLPAAPGAGHHLEPTRLIADLDSRHGTWVQGRRIGRDPEPLPRGATVKVGEVDVTIEEPSSPPPQRRDDGTIPYNRPPRTFPAPPRAGEPPVELPTPPQPPPEQRLPVLGAVLPLGGGIVFAAVFRRPEYLLFSAFAPLAAAGQWLAERLQRSRTHRRNREAYRIQEAEGREKIAMAARSEARRRRELFPEVAALACLARGRGGMPGVGPHLWERRPADEDFLVLRMGVAEASAFSLVEMKSTTAISLGPGMRESRSDEAFASGMTAIVDIPATLDVAKAGVVGIAGRREQCHALVRSLVLQIATLHSPRDLKLVLLSRHPEPWEWMRWLPHLHPWPEARCEALVGTDDLTISQRIHELCELVAARGQSASLRPTATELRRPIVVVVVDDARSVRRDTPLAALLRQGPSAGVHAICVESNAAHLPEECAAVVTLGERHSRDESPTATVTDTVQASREAHEVVSPLIRTDQISLDDAEEIARSLAPLRDETPHSEGERRLPTHISLLQLLGRTEPAELRDGTATTWRASAASTRAVIGVGLSGIVEIDLQRDGPHALVAGTTGSGKSELLQTLIASLALANRPDELAFVFIDYKGGATFGPCAELPHTTGVITDLDSALAERALRSLSAELKRRESLLAAAKTPDFSAYRRAGYPLERLLIVVDEFATLAEELPDFMSGLVGIAQRGRSLGVHLILATQRPGGAVNADILANTNLRICLGVTSESESRDIIGIPDAAWIRRDTPGRGYLRTGHGEHQLFQAARVAAAGIPEGPRHRVDITESPFASLGNPPSNRQTSTGISLSTELETIVRICREAAAGTMISAPRPPWLPPLGEIVETDDAEDRPLDVALGVRDLPEWQAQDLYRIDLRRAAHLLVVGAPRSGRTTALLTFVGRLARVTAVSDLHCYVLDGEGRLAGLADLPHCGAVVGPHELDRIRRVLNVVLDEIESRKRLIASAGCVTVEEMRRAAPPDRRPPHILVVCDGWETLSPILEELDGGVGLDDFMRLLREGPAVGIHLALSAGRGILASRLAAFIDERIVLRLPDRTDFALAGIRPAQVPATLPAGRCFTGAEGTLTQLRLLDCADPSAAAQHRAVAQLAARLREKADDAARGPRTVPPFPPRISLADLLEKYPTAGDHLLVGIGGDELAPVCLPVDECSPGLLVAGAPRSGKSTALALLADQLTRSGRPVLVVALRHSPLRHLIPAATVDDEKTKVTSWLDDTVDRPRAIVVDDAELLDDPELIGILERYTRQAKFRGDLIVVGGGFEELTLAFRGYISDVRRHRTGILLGPRSPLDGDVLGVRLPRTGAETTVAPGRGFLVRRGRMLPLLVADPERSTPGIADATP
ncbi:MAG: FHA domain-containing protein [Acidothermus sp.]|nr:FHA domain-containing protein [Acidothermus sp.]